MVKVFLGGTCNESTWRERLIELLNCDYFHPVVDDWNEEAQQNELVERANADFCLYVLTPLMSGYYSIAEVVDDSNKRPEKTLFCILDIDYNWKDHEMALRDEDLEMNIPGFIGGNSRGNVWEYGHGYTWCGDKPHSLKAVENLVESNGARIFHSLEDIACFLNNTQRLKMEGKL